jgi:hypothetical protein
MDELVTALEHCCNTSPDPNSIHNYPSIPLTCHLQAKNVTHVHKETTDEVIEVCGFNTTGSFISKVAEFSCKLMKAFLR